MDLSENKAFAQMEGSGDIHHTICLDMEKAPVRKKGSVSTGLYWCLGWYIIYLWYFIGMKFYLD